MPGDRDVFLWDEDLRGFGLKLTPAGTRTYVVQFRAGGRAAKTQRLTIGQHGPFTPASAREQAAIVLRLVAMGQDPRVTEPGEKVEGQAVRDRDASLLFEAYAAHFLLKYGAREWRPRTYASAHSNLKRWVIPVLGAQPITTINKRDLAAVFDALPSTSPALPRNIYALLRKLFSWALERGDIEANPFDQMRAPKAVKARDRVLNDEELRWVALFAGDLRPPFDTFVRMLICTGQRRDEIAAMKWSEINQKARTWTIPKERAKNGHVHTVPLNRIAMKELSALGGAKRWPRSGFVLTTTGLTSISGYSKAKTRLDLLIAAKRGEGLPAWRFHDIRRTFATNMQKLGVRFEVTEALLNHVGRSRSGVAAVYQQHEWKDEKREAMQKWSQRLMKIVFTKKTAT